MAISPTQLSPQVSLTTNADTRPVSVRTAQDNAIDQINNTPNAKKLYNAKIIGGSIGAAIPLTVAAVSFLQARGLNKAGQPISAFIKTGLGIFAASFTVAAAKIGASASNALTVFFSTRGKSSVEKTEQ